MDEKIYQVSTLSALLKGYSRKVVNVGELLKHGDTGLGTFENYDGEMVVLDGHCYRVARDGSVEEAPQDMGVPFASVAFLKGSESFEIGAVKSADELMRLLDLKIDEKFSLNSMHLVRIDGEFEKVEARSERGIRTQHVELAEVMGHIQNSFTFSGINGSLICMYFPDYMEGTNSSGWHFHFVSEDRTKGGHVFDLSIKNAKARWDRLSRLDLQLPQEAAFDTYSLADKA